jgi:hypothetical protein
LSDGAAWIEEATMERTTVATTAIIVVFGFELIILTGLSTVSVRDATRILRASGIESSINSHFLNIFFGTFLQQIPVISQAWNFFPVPTMLKEARD